MFKIFNGFRFGFDGVDGVGGVDGFMCFLKILAYSASV